LHDGRNQNKTNNKDNQSKTNNKDNQNKTNNKDYQNKTINKNSTVGAIAQHADTNEDRGDCIWLHPEANVDAEKKRLLDGQIGQEVEHYHVEHIPDTVKPKETYCNRKQLVC
jgi:hypothetical protein